MLMEYIKRFLAVLFIIGILIVFVGGGWLSGQMRDRHPQMALLGEI